MTHISLKHVHLVYPVHNTGSRSFRANLLFLGSAGRIMRESGNRIYVRALEDISFDLEPGDRLGLIGRNGSGKSTLLRVLAGVYTPQTGQVDIEGRVGALLNLDFGFDKDATGYDNIRLGCIMAGHPLKSLPTLQREIADFTELGDYLAMPLRTYSDGMRVRLSFAIATSLTPQILLMDEAIGAGDAAFAQKASDRHEELLKRCEIMVLASHSNAMIRSMCNKAILMDHGQILRFGPAEDVIGAYEDPIADDTVPESIVDSAPSWGTR